MQDKFEIALELRRKGDTEGAKLICRDLLRHGTEPVEVLHLLGLLEHETGNPAEAVELMRRAIRTAPGQGALYRTLGGIFKQCGRIKEAAACFRQAIRIDDADGAAHYELGALFFDAGQYEAAVTHLNRTAELNPEAIEAHFKMGVIHDALGKADEAIRHYRQVLTIDDQIAEAHNNLGTLHKNRGDMAAAMACFEKAAALLPNFMEALNNLAGIYRDNGQWEKAAATLDRMLKNAGNPWEIHIRKGDLFRDAGKLPEAGAQYRQAVVLAPEQSITHFKLGLYLAETGEPEKAVACYEKAIELKPDAVEPRINLGNLSTRLCRHEDAVAQYREAIRLRPGDARPRYFLGCVYRDLGNLGNSIRETQKALEIDPAYSDARFSLALSLLLSGDLPAGWKAYDCRLQMAQYQKDYVYLDRRPLWKGEPFKGKTLLVQSEQGFGDIIQFVRYLPLVKACGGKVILDTYGPLFDLFKGIPGADLVLVGTEAASPDFDLYIPLMSLPGCMGTTVETIPATVPYLFAPKDRLEEWTARIGGNGVKVGIVWAGNPKYEKDKSRSCGLKHFEAVSRLPGVQLFGLQKEVSEADAADAGRLGIPVLGDHFNDFADTAAAIHHLDLVISVDTSVAHLAGAMGKPTWTLLPFSPDFRWLLGRADSPWYPGMRLYRQEVMGEWGGVFEAVCRDVEAFRIAEG